MTKATVCALKTICCHRSEIPILNKISSNDESGIMARRRPLKLTFVNLSKSDRLCCTRTYFKVGQCYNHPVDSIPPGHKQTVYVTNRDGISRRAVNPGGLGGVSGGLAFSIKSKVKY